MHNKQVLVGQPHGEYIILARAMPLLRLLARQCAEQDKAALAPEPLAGEADLTRLHRRLVEQSGPGRNPRSGRKRRFVAFLRALRLWHLDGEGRRLPGVPKLKEVRDFTFARPKLGAQRCGIPVKQRPLIADQVLQIPVVTRSGVTFCNQFLGTPAVAGKKKSSNRGFEPGNKTLIAVTQIVIEIIKFSYPSDLAENVLVQCVKQQRGKIGIPYPAEAEINLGMEKGTFAQLK